MHSDDLASLLALVLLVVAIAALWDILRRPSDDFGRRGRSYYIWIILATAGVGGFAWFLLSRNRLRRPRRTGQPSGRRPPAAGEVQTAPAKAIAVAAGVVTGFVVFTVLSATISIYLDPSLDWLAGRPVTIVAIGISGLTYSAVVSRVGEMGGEAGEPKDRVPDPSAGVAGEMQMGGSPNDPPRRGRPRDPVPILPDYPPGSASDSTTTQKEAVELLSKLHQLHLDGALTDEEFETQKRILLGET